VTRQLQNTVVVKILDKEYQVACPPEQEAGLLQAARHLDRQMREIRSSGKVIGLERIAVMVALNNTYDLLHGSPQGKELPKNTVEGLKRLNDKVEDALQDLRQLRIS
jgi:cell division protein ZapA